MNRNNHTTLLSLGAASLLVLGGYGVYKLKSSASSASADDDAGPKANKKKKKAREGT